MKPLTLDEQAACVKWRFPKSKPEIEKTNLGRILVFTLVLKPTLTNEAYLVLFAYSLKIPRPYVRVSDPAPVKSVGGVPTPHLNSDGTLCLFDPNKNEWNPTDSLVDTTIPWTLRWLFHYEYFITFGEWKGDQNMPSPTALDAPVSLDIDLP